ncbi:MAG: tol-pal system protein YbgF [Prosthecochloris sp.]|uniref:tol-pal system protein YbgF n=1 Tax=Prosthecochloris sp. TaxID=290513 RepID=UPI0013CAF276|nr:tol-pal system protein YbgF [Prosthecochloris sp.]NEX12177.1 tol-pal system protein YbgF [Prosthecochloris sp.]
MKQRNAIIVGAIAVCTVAGCASKTDLYMVQDDVRQLKQQTNQSGGESAEVYAEVQKLRDEIASLQGTIEEMRYNAAARENAARQAILPSDASGIETLPFPIDGPSSSPETAPTVDPSVTMADSATVRGGDAPVTAGSRDDRALFDAGMNAFNGYDYAEARKEFSALLSAYPQSALADDAQYYTAETYYNEKWYEKAILEYQLVIEKYPEGDKRPAAYFKQGLSFENIGDATNAGVRYKELIQLYPDSNEAGIVGPKLQ